MDQNQDQPQNYVYKYVIYALFYLLLIQNSSYHHMFLHIMLTNYVYEAKRNKNGPSDNFGKLHRHSVISIKQEDDVVLK